MKRSNIYKEIFGNISEAIVFNEKSNNLQVPVHPNTHYYVFAGGTNKEATSAAVLTLLK